MSEKNSTRNNGFFAALAEKVGFKKNHVEAVPRPDSLSEFAKIAIEKGFINEEQAHQLTHLAAEDLENTSSDLVVQQDWMTESQAEVVCIAQAKTNPQAALIDKFKEASRALDETQTTMSRLQDVTSVGTINVADVLAAKKAKG